MPLCSQPRTDLMNRNWRRVGPFAVLDNEDSPRERAFPNPRAGMKRPPLKSSPTHPRRRAPFFSEKVICWTEDFAAAVATGFVLTLIFTALFIFGGAQ